MAAPAVPAALAARLTVAAAAVTEGDADMGDAGGGGAGDGCGGCDPVTWRDAAIRHELARARSAGDVAAVVELAATYDVLLATAPTYTAEGVRWGRATRHGRRRLGAFATPPELAEALVDRGLQPLLSDEGLTCDAFPTLARAGKGGERVTSAGPGPGAGAGALPTVVDPACGTGTLLLAAFDRLLGGGRPAVDALACLHGVDLDPLAVELARAAVTARAVRAGVPQWVCVEVTTRNLRVGDALVDNANMTWATDFAHVLSKAGVDGDPVTGWRGGFDVVLANPPWERLKLAQTEHETGDLDAARAGVRNRVTAVRTDGRHPLTGSGDLNAHLPFAETCWRLAAPGGRVALLVPASTMTDRQAGPLLRALLGTGSLESVHALADGVGWFGDVDGNVAVALMTLRGKAAGSAELADLAGSTQGPTRGSSQGASQGSSQGTSPGSSQGPSHRAVAAEVLTGLDDPRRPELARRRRWLLDARLVEIVNPSSGTAALFGSATDARLVSEAHERHGVLLRRDRDGDVADDPWRFRARTPVHLSREARHVRQAPTDGLVPLLEAKLVGLLDPRAATWEGGRTRTPTPHELADPAWTPAARWWVPQNLVEARYGDLCARGWLAAYRVVTSPRTARTLLPVALPAGGYANSLVLLDAPRLPLLLSALASLPLDYVARAKAGGHNLSIFKAEQLPVPPPTAYDRPAPWQPGTTIGEWAVHRLGAAISWSGALAPLAREIGYDVPVLRDGRDGGPDARRHARVDLDALHAHLLGWSSRDLEHALATFNALRARDEREHGRFVTRELVLAAFDRLGAPPAA